VTQAWLILRHCRQRMGKGQQQMLKETKEDHQEGRIKAMRPPVASGQHLIWTCERCHRSANLSVPTSYKPFCGKPQVIPADLPHRMPVALFPAQVSSVSCSGMTLHLGMVFITLLALIGTDT
jgi:hypothetical protein